jgi:hypothetical protein
MCVIIFNLLTSLCERVLYIYKMKLLGEGFIGAECSIEKSIRSISNG